MKKIAIILCGLGLGLLNLSAQETKETVPPLSGWKYYGGDEFNGTAINRKLWGIYGDKTRDYFCEDFAASSPYYCQSILHIDHVITISLGMVIQTMDGGQGSYPVRMHRLVIRMNRIKR